MNKIKTLFITRVLPYSPRGGSALRNWQNITIMSSFGPVGVFSMSPQAANEAPYPEVSYWQHHQLKETMKKSFSLFPSAGYQDPDYYYRKEIASDLKRVLEEFKPNLVIIVEPWLCNYAKLLDKYPFKLILDQHNVEFDIAKQMYVANNFKQKIKKQLILSKLKSTEGKITNLVEQIWACSESDAQLMKQIYPHGASAEVIPNGVNLNYYNCVRQQELPPAPEVQETSNHNLLFLGTLVYGPNSEAVDTLIKQVYPPLKQKEPRSRLVIVGSKAQPFMLEAAKQDPGIFVTPAAVPDVRPYLAAASVMVVPLQQGGGTRIKILEAFASGCPVISTAKGAEGIKALHGQHILIADTPEAMVQAVETLWGDPVLRENLINNAYNLVKQEYSWDAIQKQVDKAIASLAQ